MGARALRQSWGDEDVWEIRTLLNFKKVTGSERTAEIAFVSVSASVYTIISWNSGFCESTRGFNDLSLGASRPQHPFFSDVDKREISLISELKPEGAITAVRIPREVAFAER